MENYNNSHTRYNHYNTNSLIKIHVFWFLISISISISYKYVHCKITFSHNNELKSALSLLSTCMHTELPINSVKKNSQHCIHEYYLFWRESFTNFHDLRLLFNSEMKTSNNRAWKIRQAFTYKPRWVMNTIEYTKHFSHISQIYEFALIYAVNKALSHAHTHFSVFQINRKVAKVIAKKILKVFTHPVFLYSLLLTRGKLFDILW